jgi:hypothetical protein
LFCDKDTFLQLYKESQSLNPFLMEYLWNIKQLRQWKK